MSDVSVVTPQHGPPPGATVPSPPEKQAPDSDDAKLVHTPCGECGRLLHLNMKLAGQRIKCPHCGAAQSVPQEEPTTSWGTGTASDGNATVIPTYLESFQASPAKAWDVLVAGLTGNTACELLDKDRAGGTVTFRMKTHGLLVTILLSGEGQTDVSIVCDESQVPREKIIELGKMGKGMPICANLPVLEAGRVLLRIGVKAVVLTVLEKAGKRVGTPDQQEATKTKGVIWFLVGLVMLVVGIVATVGSYAAAGAGEVYVVFYGLILTGLLVVGKGIYEMVTGREG